MVLVDEQGNPVNIGGPPDPGSITTEMFAEDAKAPLAGLADSANAVTWANVSGKPNTFPIADNAVTTTKIAVGAVTDDKLATPKIDKPATLIPKMVIGTTLETNVLGIVPYEQTPTADHLAMYQFGGQLSAADPVADNDAANKKYVDDQLATAVLKAAFANIEPIADPSTTTTEDVATLLNSVITALKG